jgi:ribosome-associated protein
LFVDGSYESQWLIVNYPNVLVHIQSPEKREYYALEELWGDAPVLSWQEEVSLPPAAKKTVVKKATAKKAVTKKATSKKAARKAPAKKVAKKAGARKKA